MSKSQQTTMSDQLKKGLSDKRITTRSIVAFIIFGMIVVVFVLSDLSGRHPGVSNMGSAAEVNGEIISIKDFQEEENRLAQYYSQLFGGQFDNEAQRTLLRNEVMNSLVNRSLASQAAEKAGIYATDAEVRHMIVNELPYFKRDGVFQTDAYKAILTANRMTPGEFEDKLRADIKNQRLRALFESSFHVSGLQKSMEQELRATQLNLEYVALSAANFAQSSSVTDADIKTQLANPEFLKKVEEYYKANQSQYETREQVKASHILVRIDATQSDEQARAKAEGLLKRLKKEDFGQVAAEASDDPGSKAKKGDLGFFNKGQMMPEFEMVAFNTPVGQVSDLVKTTYGYHIIKVTDKKPATKAELSQVQNQIAKKLIADEKYLTFIKGIETDLAAGKSTEALAQIASARMPWKETGFFDLASEVAPGMNSAQAIKAGLELTKDQPLAKKLIREGDTQFLIRFKDTKVEPAQVAASVEDQIMKQKANAAYTMWVDNFKKSARIKTNSALTTAQQ